MSHLKRTYLAGAFTGLIWMFANPAVFAGTGTPGLQSTATSVVNMIIALVIVIILIGVLVRFLAKRANVQQRGAIQVVAARQLASNRSVQVIEVGDKRYLVGVGEDVTLLADVTDSYALTGVVPEASLAKSLSAALSSLRHGTSDEGGKRQ